MEWITIFIILISVIPFQILLLFTLCWFRNKFDKYEGIALNIINKYIDIANNTRDHTEQEIEYMREHYNFLRSDFPDYPQLSIRSTPKDVITQYKLLCGNIRKVQKRFIIERGINAIAHTLKGGYSNLDIKPAAHNPQDKFGGTIDQPSELDWLDENPFVRSALDLVSGMFI